MLRKAISKLPSLASTSVTPSCPARSCKATRQRGGRHVPDPRLSAPRGRMGLPAGRRGATFPFPLRGRSAVTSCRRRRRGEAAAGAERGGARGRRGLGGGSAGPGRGALGCAAPPSRGGGMRRSRAPRLALAACFGSFLLGVFYFQSSLNPGGSQTWTLRGSARFVLKRSAVPAWELFRGWDGAAVLRKRPFRSRQQCWIARAQRVLLEVSSTLGSDSVIRS